MAILILILFAVCLGVACGAIAALGIWLRLIFARLDALVQQVPRGVMLFVRLATWLTVRLAKLVRWSYRMAARVALWGVQHAYVWLFVGCYRLRAWYVANELKRRSA